MANNFELMANYFLPTPQAGLPSFSPCIGGRCCAFVRIPGHCEAGKARLFNACNEKPSPLAGEGEQRTCADFIGIVEMVD
jgi:hypothetical protein